MRTRLNVIIIIDLWEWMFSNGENQQVSTFRLYRLPLKRADLQEKKNIVYIILKDEQKVQYLSIEVVLNLWYVNLEGPMVTLIVGTIFISLC